jgi:hypothetical protein
MDRFRPTGCDPFRAACHLVSSGINRVRSRPVACLISLAHGMFWWDWIVWSTWNFFLLPNCPCQLQVILLYFLLISIQSHTLCCNHVQLQTDRQGWCEEGNLRLPDGYIKDLTFCLNFSWPCMYAISPSYTHNNETKKMVKVYKTMVRFIWWP